jgi:hypothetical protein
MSPEDATGPEHQASPPPGDDLPVIEDAYSPDAALEEEVGEDDPQLLDSTARSLEADAAETESDEQGAPGAASEAVAKVVEQDDTSDTEAVTDEGEPDAASKPEVPKWDRELSSQKIVVELKRIESEVRRLLEPWDSKRKRKLSGTRRWRELEEDIISWRFTSRISEPTLQRLQELVTRRHHLFRQLRFVAGTRPTWNT